MWKLTYLHQQKIALLLSVLSLCSCSQLSIDYSNIDDPTNNPPITPVQPDPPQPDPPGQLLEDLDIPKAQGPFSEYLPIPYELDPAHIGTQNFIANQPIGGGEGYTLGPQKNQADYVITGSDSLQKLRNTLNDAQYGEIIWLEKNFSITDQALRIPDNVMLAGDRGQDGSLGAKITCDFNPGGNDPCIKLGLDSVVTGFRVFGTSNDSNQERGVLCGIGEGKGYIANMEVKHFEDSGLIFINGDRGWVAHSDIGEQHYDAIYNGPNAGLGYFFNLKISWYWNAVAVGQNNNGAGQGFILKRSQLTRELRTGVGGADYAAETHETQNYNLNKERKVIVKHNTFLAAQAVDMGCLSFFAGGCGPWYDVKIGTANVATTVVVANNYFSRNKNTYVQGNSDNGWGLAYFIEGNGVVNDTLSNNSYADER